MSSPRGKARNQSGQSAGEAELPSSMNIVADDDPRPLRLDTDLSEHNATAWNTQGVLGFSSFDGWLSSFTPNTGTAVEMPTLFSEHDLSVSDGMYDPPTATEMRVMSELSGTSETHGT